MQSKCGTMYLQTIVLITKIDTMPLTYYNNIRCKRFNYEWRTNNSVGKKMDFSLGGLL